MDKIQTLVSTMNRENIKFLDGMNVQTNVIIGNQSNTSSECKVSYNNLNVRVINSEERGLSKNRNVTIKYANSEICLLADDDIQYCDHYPEIVERAFERYKNADIIIFNLFENPIERYVIKKAHRVIGLEILRYGSVRIAFKRQSIIKTKINFDERFGAGGNIPIGEDTIFLNDCLKKGLIIYAVPNHILSLKESSSTWFSGYNKAYFINKGKMYYRMYGRLYHLIAFQDVVRHRKQYKGSISTKQQLRYINFGAKEFQTLDKRG